MSKVFRITKRIIESAYIHADSEGEALEIYEQEGGSEWCDLSTEIEEVE